MNALQQLWEGFCGLFSSRNRWERIAGPDLPLQQLVMDRLVASHQGIIERRSPHQAIVQTEVGDVDVSVLPREAEVVHVRFAPRCDGHESLKIRNYDHYEPTVRTVAWPSGEMVSGLRVHGDPTLLASLLAFGTRRRLPQLVTSGRLKVTGGVTSFQADLGSGEEWAGLGRRAALALELAVLVQDAASQLMLRLEERIADPLPSVRRHAARLLVERLDGPEVMEWFDRLMAVGDAGVARSIAGFPDGVPRLSALAGSKGKAGPRAAAALALLDHLDEAKAAVASALGALKREDLTPLALGALESADAGLRVLAVERLRSAARDREGCRSQLGELDRLLAALPGEPRDTVVELLVCWLERARGEALVRVAEALLERGARDRLTRGTTRLVELVTERKEVWWQRAFRVAGRLPAGVNLDRALRELFEAEDAAAWQAGLELVRVHDRSALCGSLGQFERWMPAADVSSTASLLGRIGGPEAREHLHRLLSHAHPDPVLFSIYALGACGSLESVEPLLAAEERERGEAKDAAREAIDAIQARLGPDERGGLSVLTEEGERGGLSVAEQEGGLVLTDDDE